MVKVAIIGGSGYTGLELMRLVARHPGVELTAVTSREFEGKPVSAVFPALAGICSLNFSWPDPAKLAAAAELFFVALPHKTAMAVIPTLLTAGAKVVDLSADFRFRDKNLYEQWYQEHTSPDLLREAVYGLPELYREAIKNTRLVGNPGCYPTSVILGLAPLLAAELIEPQSIIADCKSGASGAGRGVSLGTLYCEVNDGFRAYKVAEHRHTPEMEQELGLLAGEPLTITFTPHLVPMSRGILATLYATPKRRPGRTRSCRRCISGFIRTSRSSGSARPGFSPIPRQCEAPTTATWPSGWIGGPDGSSWSRPLTT